VLAVLVDVLVPVFLVVGLGFVVARRVGAKPESLATLAYWVLGPVFIFDILSRTSLQGDVVGKLVGVSLLVMVVAGLLAALATKITEADRQVVSASVLTSIYPNAGNFGLAISAFAFGPEALPIAGIVMVTVNTGGILTGVGLANMRNGSRWAAVRAAFLSPLALAVVPALLVNINDVMLPTWLDRPVTLVAAAMIPVMLLTLGIQLAGMSSTVPDRKVAIPVLVRLVFAPLIAAGAVSILGPSGMAGSIVILIAAMPAAVFTSLIALEHDLEADYVTSVVLVSTLVSAITLPVVISLL
jgi:hypothetical protein